MKLKTIFWIAAVLTALQMLPLIGAMISPDIKAALVLDAFGVETLSPDGNLLFDTFVLVVGCIVTGIFFMIIGMTSIEDLAALKRLSFLLFVVMGFLALPDLINAFAGKPTAPLPVILLNLAALGLLLYGSKKGTV
jgi:predicted membrane channel-forming protein YqfA (hemolysin III family)|tara:strand:- start:4713 stop:5120 length:408 start_codon:yes stop_codon:yes gene_type:complete